MRGGGAGAMSADLVLAADCSTTAAKAVVWDMKGGAVAEGRASYPLSVPAPGWGEQHPVDWWSALEKAIVAAVRQIDPCRLAALAITHQRETFVCLDDHGEPLRPAMLWLDARAHAEVVEFGDDRVHALTGKPPNTATSWYKLLWLKKHEPQVLRQTRWVADVHAYLVHRLTGRWRTSYGSVDPLGLLDLRTFTLEEHLLAAVGLEAGQIPEIAPPGARLGVVRDEVASALGLPRGLPVIAGTGDGQAAGLGANVTAPGTAYLNLGTGMVSGTFSREYRYAREFRTMSGSIPGTYAPETFIGGGTFNINWFVERLADIPARPFGLDLGAESLLELAASKVAPGSEGLFAVPNLAGALSPYWDPNARGVYFGLSPQHGKAHLYRALLEGLAFEQRLATSAAEPALGSPVVRFRLMGGGSRSVLWRQILADVLARPLEITREAETTSLGAAMLAAAGVGLFDGIVEAAEAMSGVAATCAPADSTRALYARHYEVYRSLYPSLREVFAQLQALGTASGV